MKMGTNHVDALIEAEARKVTDMQLQLQLLYTEQVLFTIFTIFHTLFHISGGGRFVATEPIVKEPVGKEHSVFASQLLHWQP